MNKNLFSAFLQKATFDESRCFHHASGGLFDTFPNINRLLREKRLANRRIFRCFWNARNQPEYAASPAPPDRKNERGFAGSVRFVRLFLSKPREIRNKDVKKKERNTEGRTQTAV